LPDCGHLRNADQIGKKQAAFEGTAARIVAPRVERQCGLEPPGTAV